MPHSNVHIVLNSRDRTSGTYNSSLFNAVNQNILQGDIESVAVNEVNFPYDIPNIQTATNTIILATPAQYLPRYILPITIVNGFYNGTELEVALNQRILAQGLALFGLPATALPIFFYDTTNNRFNLEPPAGPFAPGPPDTTNCFQWFVFSPYTYYSANLAPPIPQSTLGKDMLSLMGYLPEQVFDPPNFNSCNAQAVGGAGEFYAAQAASLKYTQYIDICSPQLCKFQYFRDGSTTNLARRSDVICRLFITNNIATQEEEGVRPFVINRQFLNSRVMKWTANNSVGTIDINLFDDVGQPLATTWGPRNYQITFNAYERKRDLEI